MVLSRLPRAAEPPAPTFSPPGAEVSGLPQSGLGDRHLPPLRVLQCNVWFSHLGLDSFTVSLICSVISTSLPSQDVRGIAIESPLTSPPPSFWTLAVNGYCIGAPVTFSGPLSSLALCGFNHDVLWPN